MKHSSGCPLQKTTPNLVLPIASKKGLLAGKHARQICPRLEDSPNVLLSRIKSAGNHQSD